eukprot:TRINITY_DN15575_c0_g1_i3.p1 TRINITY_DN15575_c0_g1~~TRINITY_DN15575_c0_g1_i3.p1  ORF type:complete len:371 (-),score=37.91 TRINITY_DN15575_c0_g1_i3:527-1639(-)
MEVASFNGVGPGWPSQVAAPSRHRHNDFRRQADSRPRAATMRAAFASARSDLARATSEARAFGEQRSWQQAAAVLCRSLQREARRGLYDEPFVDAVFFGTVMTACSKAMRWDVVLRLFGDMLALGYLPNTQSCASAARAMQMRPNVKRALGLLGQLREGDLDSDTFAWEAVLGVAAQAGWELAVHVLERMQQEHLSPTASARTVIMSTCSRGMGQQWRWAVALQVLEDARSDDCLCLTEYNAAISLVGKGRQWKRAIHLLQEMREDKIPPDVISCNAAITACQLGMKPEAALRVHRSMAERLVEADQITYSATMCACERGSLWERSLAVLGDMQDCELVRGRRPLDGRRRTAIVPIVLTEYVLVCFCGDV